MDAKNYDQAVAWLTKYGNQIADGKRPAYTHSDADVLRNFKEGAIVTATSWLQYWAAHFHKHLSTVVSYGKNPDGPQAEPLESRFGDLRNYIFLGFSLYCDMVKERTGYYPWEAQPTGSNESTN